METTRYSLLGKTIDARLLWLQSIWKQRLLQLLGVFLVITLSFWAGRRSAYTDLHSEVKLRRSPRLFEFNRTFGERPSPETNQAWAQLFPQQGGFFKHPQLAPQRSALAVFHLLHCVDGIRHGYWKVLDAALAGEKINEDEIPFMSSPKHIRHCIDLLRNSLMCYPDTTVELKDVEIGGVTGFGTMHQCRDWNQLVDWTAQWEHYKQEKKPDAPEDQHKEEHGHDEHHQ